MTCCCTVWEGLLPQFADENELRDLNKVANALLARDEHLNPRKTIILCSNTASVRRPLKNSSKAEPVECIDRLLEGHGRYSCYLQENTQYCTFIKVYIPVLHLHLLTVASYKSYLT